MMKIANFVTLFSLLFALSCKKNDVNFDKYNSSTLNPEIYTPIGQAIVRSRDIFKPDSTLKYDTDGNIKYVFPSDTFLNISADTLLNGVKLGKSVSVFTLGNISVNIDNQTLNTTLQQVNNRNVEPNKTAINDLDGKNAKFPGFSVADLDIDTIPEFPNFTYIEVVRGVLTCQVENNWPTNISELSLSLLDLTKAPSEQVIGRFNFTNIPTNQTVIDSLIIGGETINNKIGTKIESIKLDSSATNVDIQLSKALDIDLMFSQFRVSGGLAIVPEQPIPKRFATVDLSDKDSKEMLKTVEFGNALIPVSINSTFESGATLRLSLPDAERDGVVSPPIVVDVDNGTTSTSVDLSNMRLDMGNDVNQPYNMLRIEFDGTLKSSGKQIYFSADNAFTIQYDATDAEFKYADGYLGSDTFEVFLKNLNVSQLTDFLENLRIENPNMSVNVSNSFGVPSEVELIVTAKSNNGNTLKLDINKMFPPYPEISERGTIKYDNFLINNSNSNFSDGLKLPAETFDVTARVTFNQNGFQGFTNHLVDNSILVVSFGAEIPLEMSTSEIVYYDTIDATNTFNTIANIQEVECKILTENLFPFDAEIDLFFVDANYETIDSNISVQLVKSAILDVDGSPVSPSTLESRFFLSKSNLENFQNRQPRHIVVRAKISTTDNGTKVVKILERCYLKTSLGIRTILKTTI